MAIKSAGTYMQLSNLCKRCSKQSFCGNGMTDYFCTGYEPQVKTASDIKTPPFDADVELDKLDKANDIKVPPFTDGQKEVIEATEKLAKKRGGKICDVDDDITDIKELLNDTIKRIEEPTNEDWLKSMTTEELAEFIIGERKGCVYADCPNGETPCMSCKDGCDIDKLVEWLKQPHKGE